MIGDKIVGSDEKYSLEDRCLNAVIFVAIIISTLSFISDLLQQLGPKSYVYSGSTAIAFGVLYYFGRKKPNHKKLLWPFLIIDIIPNMFGTFLMVFPDLR